MSRETYSVIRLREAANVEISGVDKKWSEKETEVRLCNYVDVYYSWAITRRGAVNFMKASANESQIKRFTLKKGQVALTKDSETKYDIGISAYIADDLDGTVLGYHCALITPDETKVNGKYLNAFLHTKFIQRYFELNATGSGQRYALSIDALNNIPLYLPPMEIQEKVGDLFSKIDRKIELNQEIYDSLEGMAKLMYDYWFVQFDFPDSDGRPYRSFGGQMQWNEGLKRFIPKDWQCRRILDVASIANESVNPQNYGEQIMEHYSIPAFDESGFPRYEAASSIESNKYVVKKNSILVSKLNPRFKRIWDPFCETDYAICSTEFIVYSPVDCRYRSFLYAVLNSDAFYIHSVGGATSSTGSRKRIQPEISASYKFPYPQDEKVLAKFCDFYDPILQRKKDLRKENQQLKAMKDWLLPVLMSGQISFTKND